MAIRINKIDKGDIVKIFEDSPNATSYYALWYKEFPVLEIDEKKKVAIIEHCGEHCMISFDDLKFVKEEDVEMAKRGMMVADSKKKIEEMSLKEADPYMSIWHNEKANFFFPKDMIYIWFYDYKDAGKKLSTDEYDPMLFPPGYWGQRTPPLMQVWTKGYQKKVRGSEHILGVIQGYLKDGDLNIQMMTVKPTYRRNKINSLMVRTLKKEFNPKKVIFLDTTKMGKSFEGSGKYAKGGGLDEDIYGFHNIPIEVSKKNYDEAISFRERYKLFPNIGIATFLSSPILWRVVDQNEYDIIMRIGKVTGGEFSIKPEREMGPSFTGSRSNAVAFGLAWKKANRLKGQLYLIGINAEDKEFLNLSMVERFEKQGLKYEVGDYDIHSSLGDSSLGFSVRNVSLQDVNYIYEVSDNGELKDITYDVIKH